MLHRKRQIVHRDLSSGNILFREMTRPESRCIPPDLRDSDMCFIHCLLESQEEPTIKDRLSTSLLLTDFDCGQDKEVKTQSSMPRTGTSIFMAYMVRNNVYQTGNKTIPAIPQVHSDLISRYQSLLPDRLTRFPENEEELKPIPKGEKRSDKDFEHLLRHDAESVFWCMVWWSIQVKPKGSGRSELLQSYWTNLTDDQKDHRYHCYVNTTEPFPLHQDYGPVNELLDQMREYLKVDLKYSEDERKRNDPEYLCEVFQRLILNFLVEYQGSPFLTLERDAEFRKVGEPCGGGAMSTTTGTKESYLSRSSVGAQHPSGSVYSSGSSNDAKRRADTDDSELEGGHRPKRPRHA